MQEVHAQQQQPVNLRQLAAVESSASVQRPSIMAGLDGRHRFIVTKVLRVLQLNIMCMVQ